MTPAEALLHQAELYGRADEGLAAAKLSGDRRQIIEAANTETRCWRGLLSAALAYANAEACPECGDRSVHIDGGRVVRCHECGVPA